MSYTPKIPSSWDFAYGSVVADDHKSEARFRLSTPWILEDFLVWWLDGGGEEDFVAFLHSTHRPSVTSYRFYNPDNKGES